MRWQPPHLATSRGLRAALSGGPPERGQSGAPVRGLALGCISEAVTTTGGSADAPGCVYRPSLGPTDVRGEVRTSQREELCRCASSTQRGGGARLSRAQVPRNFARNTTLSTAPSPPSSPRSFSSLHMDPAAGVFPSSECALCSLQQLIRSMTSAAAGARSGRVLESHLFPGFSTPRRTDSYGAVDTPSRGTSTRRYLDRLCWPIDRKSVV